MLKCVIAMRSAIIGKNEIRLLADGILFFPIMIGRMPVIRENL